MWTKENAFIEIHFDYSIALQEFPWEFYKNRPFSFPAFYDIFTSRLRLILTKRLLWKFARITSARIFSCIVPCNLPSLMPSDNIENFFDNISVKSTSFPAVLIDIICNLLLIFSRITIGGPVCPFLLFFTAFTAKNALFPIAVNAAQDRTYATGESAI